MVKWLLRNIRETKENEIIIETLLALSQVGGGVFILVVAIVVTLATGIGPYQIVMSCLYVGLFGSLIYLIWLWGIVVPRSDYYYKRQDKS